ncbi:UNVERIFIED_CONTAM: DNA polymerase delta subunit 4, partial [Siphonaria sp. JEL0065]
MGPKHKPKPKKQAVVPRTPKKQIQPSIAAYVTPVSLPAKRKVEDRDQAASDSEDDNDDGPTLTPGLQSPSKRAAQRIKRVPPPPPLTDAEKEMLHQFDLDTKFGPNVGISRLDRWERAKKFDLDPPTHILEILNVEGRQSIKEIQEALWPNPKAPPTWQLLGLLSNEKPSAVFKLGQKHSSSGSGGSDSTMMEDSHFNLSSEPPITASLGISIEPLESCVRAVEAAKGHTDTSMTGSEMALSTARPGLYGAEPQVIGTKLMVIESVFPDVFTISDFEMPYPGESVQLLFQFRIKYTPRRKCIVWTRLEHDFCSIKGNSRLVSEYAEKVQNGSIRSMNDLVTSAWAATASSDSLHQQQRPQPTLHNSYLDDRPFRLLNEDECRLHPKAVLIPHGVGLELVQNILFGLVLTDPWNHPDRSYSEEHCGCYKFSTVAKDNDHRTSLKQADEMIQALLLSACMYDPLGPMNYLCERKHMHQFAQVLVRSPKQDEEGFIIGLTPATSPGGSDGKAYVAFSGTKDWNHIRQALSFLPATINGLPTLSSLGCHSGYLEIAEKIPDIIGALQNLGYNDIILCGHSRGGAISHLVLLLFLYRNGTTDEVEETGTTQSMDASINWDSKVPEVRSFAFASPFVVNEAVSLFLSDRGLHHRFLNVVNDGDVIPGAMSSIGGLSTQVITSVTGKAAGIDLDAIIRQIGPLIGAAGAAIGYPTSAALGVVVGGYLWNMFFNVVIQKPILTYKPIGRYIFLRKNPTTNPTASDETNPELVFSALCPDIRDVSAQQVLGATAGAPRRVKLDIVGHNLDFIDMASEGIVLLGFFVDPVRFHNVVATTKQKMVVEAVVENVVEKLPNRSSVASIVITPVFEGAKPISKRITSMITIDSNSQNSDGTSTHTSQPNQLADGTIFEVCINAFKRAVINRSHELRAEAMGFPAQPEVQSRLQAVKEAFSKLEDLCPPKVVSRIPRSTGASPTRQHLQKNQQKAQFQEQLQQTISSNQVLQKKKSGLILNRGTNYLPNSHRGQTSSYTPTPPCRKMGELIEFLAVIDAFPDGKLDSAIESDVPIPTDRSPEDQARENLQAQQVMAAMEEASSICSRFLEVLCSKIDITLEPSMYFVVGTGVVTGLVTALSIGLLIPEAPIVAAGIGMGFLTSTAVGPLGFGDKVIHAVQKEQDNQYRFLLMELVKWIGVASSQKLEFLNAHTHERAIEERLQWLGFATAVDMQADPARWSNWSEDIPGMSGALFSQDYFGQGKVFDRATKSCMGMIAKRVDMVRQIHRIRKLIVEETVVAFVGTQDAGKTTAARKLFSHVNKEFPKVWRGKEVRRGIYEHTNGVRVFPQGQIAVADFPGSDSTALGLDQAMRRFGGVASVALLFCHFNGDASGEVLRNLEEIKEWSSRIPILLCIHQAGNKVNGNESDFMFNNELTSASDVERFLNRWTQTVQSRFPAMLIESTSSIDLASKVEDGIEVSDRSSASTTGASPPLNSSRRFSSVSDVTG